MTSNTSSLKAFRCSTCGRDFTTAYSMRRHQEIHNPNFQPYKCTVCEAQFNWKDNLRAHMMCVHGQRFDSSTSEKKFLNN